MAELLIEIDERYKDAHGNPRVLAVCPCCHERKWYLGNQGEILDQMRWSSVHYCDNCGTKLDWKAERKTETQKIREQTLMEFLNEYYKDSGGSRSESYIIAYRTARHMLDAWNEEEQIHINARVYDRRI